MRPAPPPGVLLVATREIRWMLRDRVALVLAIGMPLLAFAVLSWTFSNPVIRDLRITIVDADRTPTSLLYVEAVSAAPTVIVAGRSGDLTAAMHAIRSGDAIASVYVPAHFESDLVAQKRPQIVVFTNRQYLTAGNNAANGIATALSAATATLPSPGPGSGFRPGSLVVEPYVLTNPSLNFAQFLLRAVLPTVLHMVTAIAAGYAVGSEFSRRSVAAWLEAAGGSPLAALVGKLAPLFVIFILMMAVVAAVIHGVFQVPFRGDSLQMGVAACLLVIAYLSIGTLFQLLVRNLATGLSLTALVCSPAFGFAGIGFPLFAMSGFAQAWGWFLPLRWYMQILFDQAVRGLPTVSSAVPFAVLGGFAIAMFGLSWLRLRSLVSRPAGEPPRAPAVARPSSGAGIVAAMRDEIRRVAGDRGVFGLMVLAPLVYGALYPQPYLGQVLRSIPVAVVDQDGSELSRQLVQTLDADEAVRVAVRADTLAEAQAALARRDVFAIMVIPQGSEREVLKGNTSRIAAYVDSAYFLLYNRTLQGMKEAAAVVSAEVASGAARSDGSLARAALTRVSPVEIVTEPLFNPTGGYASYVVPAAFVLILQQTILMGAAMLAGIAFEDGGAEARRRRGGARAILGQALAHLGLALPGVALYMIVLPRVYGFSALGRPLDILLLVVPFLLASSLLGQFVGAWFRRRETAVLVFVATSLPLFFLVGVAWPVESIPDALRAASRAFPSTSAIDGLVRVNQMGATLRDVRGDWTMLWVLAALYALLAMATGWVRRARGLRHAT